MKKLVFTALAVGLSFTASFMAQVPNYVPTNGLVGWWPFNGNANDESGNGNNGTVNGATLTSDRFGNAAKAFSFDGIDDWINILYSNSLHNSNGTINAWIKTNGLYSTQKNIYGQAQGRPQLVAGSQGINTNQQTRFAAIQWKANNSQYPGAQSISYVDDSQWKMITGLYSTDTFKLFINGLLEYTFITNLNQDNCSFSDFQIGGYNTNLGCGNTVGYSQIFDGIIDDVGSWNRALSDQEISDLYNGNICYEFVTVTDTLVINTGITGYNPITYLNTLKIWPNPTNDHITIDAGNLATMNGYSIKIEDAQGQQVFQNAVNQQQFYVDITTWGGNGLYFVRIIDPQGNTVDIKKIVLQ